MREVGIELGGGRPTLLTDELARQAELDELRKEIPSLLEEDDEDIIIQHLYIELRMEPLNLYLERADKSGREDMIEQSGEMNSLRQWRAEVEARRPVSDFEKLRRQLDFLAKLRTLRRTYHSLDKETQTAYHLAHIKHPDPKVCLFEGKKVVQSTAEDFTKSFNK